MHIKIIKVLLFIFTVLLISSCDRSIDSTKLINKEINRKLEKYTLKKLNECRLNAIEEAEIYVDSIIKDITHNAIGSNIDFPDKPTGRDTANSEFDIKIDSIKVEEIVDSLNVNPIETNDTINLDTILQ